jgi:hypothetical protein
MRTPQKRVKGFESQPLIHCVSRDGALPMENGNIGANPAGNLNTGHAIEI